MKGTAVRSYITENLLAVQPHNNAMRAANRIKMCWQCQKDKPTHGGHLDLRRGIHKFVCADCMAAKKAKNETIPTQNTD